MSAVGFFLPLLGSASFLAILPKWGSLFPYASSSLLRKFLKCSHTFFVCLLRQQCLPLREAFYIHPRMADLSASPPVVGHTLHSGKGFFPGFLFSCLFLIPHSPILRKESDVKQAVNKCSYRTLFVYWLSCASAEMSESRWLGSM